MLRPYSEWDETLGTDGANVEAHYHLWTNICGFHDVRSAGSAKKQKPNKANTNDTQIP